MAGARCGDPDTAELTPRVDEPLPVPSDESDLDVVVPRPPASPSRPGFKSQARRVVIASRFVEERARRRPWKYPHARVRRRRDSSPFPESPSAPPRVVNDAGPAAEVVEESDVDATSSGCVTPREDGVPEGEREEALIPVESPASGSDRSPRARASDVVRN